jgi:multiple sugar transport system substrate-binding protein
LVVLFLVSACVQSPAQPAPQQEQAAPAEGAAEAEAPQEEAEAEEAEGAAEASSDEVVELRWLQWWVNEWGPENHAQLIEGFEATHPNIKVTVVDVPWPDMAGKLQAAAAGGAETYDVFGTESTWLSGLDKQGFVENLDSWLEGDPEFAESLTTSTPLVLHGQTKGLCLYLIPYQFAYNVDVFEEKGLEPPTNWDEFVAVMEALRDEASGSYGMSMPLQDAGFIMTRYFGFRLAQEGGKWFDEEGNVVFNSPEGVAAMQWWKDFYDKGLVVPGSLGEDQSQMLEFVATEQVPAIIDGPFIWTKAKQLNPDIRLAYAPAWTAKTGGYSWACSGMGMAANTPHKEEAWEFIKYIYSDEVSQKMTETISLLWATDAGVAALEGSDDPLLSQVPAFANQDPEHNVTFPVLPEATKLVDAFGLAFQQVMAGEKDAQTALDEAAAVWQAELSAAE